MKISKVISYKNSWKSFKEEHSEELRDILDILPVFVTEYLKVRKKGIRFGPSWAIWNDLLSQRNWIVQERIFRSDSGHRVSISNIGPVKNSVSAFVSFGYFEILNRWLFQQTVIANKYEIAKIPILLVPTYDYSRKIEERVFERTVFEALLEQLQPLVPLSHGYPFLIIGFDDSLSGDIELHELESDIMVEDTDVVIDRCIEFTPEFHQAGVGILSYFSTYLNEQYPDENAKVKIEQNGQIVRLIIETSNGKKEIIEKALTDYQLVISGQKRAEDVTQNQKLILELNSELRIAKYRIETQQDIIQIQGGQIDKLLTMIGNGLASKNQIYVDFKPQISLNNSSYFNSNVTDLVSIIAYLKSLVPSADPQYILMEDLVGSLETIEMENDPEIVKKSPALSKLKKFIENVANGDDNLSKTIKAAENGWEMFKNLAGKYNMIAEWCGLPQVPTIFTK